MEAIDYDQPLSSLLRSATAQKHAEVEHSPAAKVLASGTFSDDFYWTYLKSLHLIYSTLEQALLEHATNDVLAPLYRPTIYSRTNAIEADLAYWTDPSAASPCILPQAQAYARYLQRISQEQPELLASHAYVRYLGDISGGQIVKRRLMKARKEKQRSSHLARIDDGADGLSFYDFYMENETDVVTPSHIKMLRTAYREALDLVQNVDTKSPLPIRSHPPARCSYFVLEMLAQEAVTAFDWNIKVFHDLEKLTDVKMAEHTTNQMASFHKHGIQDKFSQQSISLFGAICLLLSFVYYVVAYK